MSMDNDDQCHTETERSTMDGIIAKEPCLINLNIPSSSDFPFKKTWIPTKEELDISKGCSPSKP